MNKDDFKIAEYKEMPIIVSSDVKPDPLARLYLIDLDHIEIPYCDCINYDMNGNRKCPIHKGKLQTFYPQHEIINNGMRYGKNHILELNDKLPYCNQHLGMSHYVIEKGYVTCRTCLKREFNERKEKWRKLKNESTYITMGELECKEFPSGRIRDLE